MKKILVPTDFSQQAENALELASQFARKFDAEIFLMHMVELPVDMVNPVGETRSNDLPEALYFMKLAKKRFDEVLARPFLKDVRVHDTVEFHQAFEGIMEMSNKYDCDFIIMGSKGSKGLKEMFIGSNTEKVVRTSEVPVLVIKNPHPDFQLRNMIFATNLDPESKSTLSKALQFAELFEANFHLVYVNTPNEFITSKEIDDSLANFLENHPSEKIQFHVHNDESVEEGILNFSRKMQGDLIGIATHGRKGLSHFFNGSISEDLVNHAKQPVITFRIEK